MRLDMQRRFIIIFIGTLVVSTAGAGAQQAPANTTVKTPAAAHLTGSAATRTADLLSTIKGIALNATSGPLTNAPVRLRDARFGRNVDEAVTDRSGSFAFHSLEPGSYV